MALPRTSAFDSFSTALILWIMSEHWSWWSAWPVRVTAGDVPGMRRAAWTIFCLGCISLVVWLLRMTWRALRDAGAGGDDDHE